MSESPIDTYGDKLELHEIDFLHRFIALGEQVEWIPRHSFLPTHDFVWTSNNNLLIELKTVVARRNAIWSRIENSTRKAALHGVVKDRFIVDLQDQTIEDNLLEGIETYNVGRRNYRIAQLWIMHNTTLNEIILEN